MALKHYTGTIREPAVVWKCPTCGAENAGPLKEGCTACKAGADAKAAAEQAKVDRVEFPAPPSFVAWWDIHKAEALKLNGYEIARLAYQAGYDMGRVQWTPVQPSTVPLVPVEPVDGLLLAFVHPQTHESTLTDTRTHQTILAALAFYRDNQLAYGALPGQLSAEETTALIATLSPADEVPA